MSTMCYCANFYGAINCHNRVIRFGDRCKLCIVLKAGASMSEGILTSEFRRGYLPTPPEQAEPSLPLQRVMTLQMVEQFRRDLEQLARQQQQQQPAAGCIEQLVLQQQLARQRQLQQAAAGSNSNSSSKQLRRSS